MLQNEVARQRRDEHNTKSGQHNTSGATSPQRPHHRNGATRQTARQVEQLFVPVAPLSGATRGRQEGWVVANLGGQAPCPLRWDSGTGPSSGGEKL